VISVDRFPGASSSIRMKVSETLVVEAYENPDLQQKFYTNMEREHRDVLFLIWSNYTPLETSEPIPVNFEKLATRSDGTTYNLPVDLFDSTGRGGLRRLFVQCDKPGQA
jgi:hypothetical protein